MKSVFKFGIFFITSLIIITSILDLIRINNYKFYKSLPSNKITTEIDEIYYELENGTTLINWERLNTTLDYISNQYDVADFKLNSLVRLLYKYHENIPRHVLLKIEQTIFNFRYWMDEPGENGMCYWSENHQILFSSSEYLLGQMYPDKVFNNDKKTGSEHMLKARKRILDWLEMKWKFGFSEFYSNVYYNETIAGVINLIDFAKDEKISKKASIIMDLIMYDIAAHKNENMFLSVSGRAYEKNRKGDPKSSFKNIINHIWYPYEAFSPHLNYGFVTSKKYKLPTVIKEIGNDRTNVIIKQCNGLDISEFKNEGYFGSDERSIMMQWGSGAFSNYEIIRNSIEYIKGNNLFSNEFLASFKYLDFKFFEITYLDKFLAYVLNPQTNGVAIQKANTYTFRTKDYSLYTIQNYSPGTFADQQHITGMNLGNSFAVFHTHPAVNENVKSQSPNYWVGYGHRPHSVQNNNVSLSIYNIPLKKQIMELDLLSFTHAYFPTKLFDSVYISKNYAFGKKDSAYIALIGKNNFTLNLKNYNDLLQKGNKTFWIIEAGSLEDDKSFKNFIERILLNKIKFNERDLTLEYISGDQKYELKYNGKFLINNSEIITKYTRYDSPYIQAKIKPKIMNFKCNSKFLHLDFYNLKREFN
ncbi:MAG: hypothetical protein HYS24_06785 [Ignavibacteriales bacterium]|nr:hypothetical protein [Ignavibacteriales bacterium]